MVEALALLRLSARLHLLALLKRECQTGEAINLIRFATEETRVRVTFRPLGEEIA